MGARKMVVKVNIPCAKCRDKLLGQISAVSGVKKVESTTECCPVFTIVGDFKVEDILNAAGKKRRCLKVESVEELPPPPKPKPEPKPEPKPDPPKAPPPKEIVITEKGWPKKLPNVPPGTSLVIVVENLSLCPKDLDHHGGGHGCECCDSCC